MTSIASSPAATPTFPTAVASPPTKSATSARSTITCKSGFPAISTCCARGASGRRLPGEAQPRARDVVAVGLDAQPLTLQQLGGIAGHVRAGERIQDQLPRRCQEANEKIGQRQRE